jgi:hypothetical protein
LVDHAAQQVTRQHGFEAAQQRIARLRFELG